jgi:hypothetical protein
MANWGTGFWDDARTAKLCELWGQGKTGSQIADMLQCTKNMVIAKARREGLASRPSPIKAAKPAAKSKPKPKKIKVAPKKRGRPRKSALAQDQSPFVPFRDHTHITAEFRHNSPNYGQCQFIHGELRKDWTWCKKPTAEEAAFCPEHEDLCYVAPYSPAERQVIKTMNFNAAKVGKATAHLIPNS